jgi:hypothetical protein
VAWFFLNQWRNFRVVLDVRAFCDQDIRFCSYGTVFCGVFVCSVEIRCLVFIDIWRHPAASRKVTGSNRDGVIGIIHWHNPSGRSVALGSTQPLTEMSTRNTSWGGKGGRCVGLTNLTRSCAGCLKSECLNLLEFSGPEKGLLHGLLYLLTDIVIRTRFWEIMLQKSYTTYFLTLYTQCRHLLPVGLFIAVGKSLLFRGCINRRSM